MSIKIKIKNRKKKKKKNVNEKHGIGLKWKKWVRSGVFGGSKLLFVSCCCSGEWQKRKGKLRKLRCMNHSFIALHKQCMWICMCHFQLCHTVSSSFSPFNFNHISHTPNFLFILLLNASKSITFSSGKLVETHLPRLILHFSHTSLFFLTFFIFISF